MASVNNGAGRILTILLNDPNVIDELRREVSESFVPRYLEVYCYLKNLPQQPVGNRFFLRRRPNDVRILMRKLDSCKSFDKVIDKFKGFVENNPDSDISRLLVAKAQLPLSGLKIESS